MPNSRPKLLIRQTMVAIVIAALLAAAAFFFGIPGVADSPWQLATRKDQLQQRLSALKAENDRVEPYQTHMADLDRQTDMVRAQMEAMLAILPDEEQAQQFQATMQKDAKAAGVQLREFAPLPLVSREFFAEAPFQMNVAGGYNAVVDFFKRVAHEYRISSASSLLLTTAANEKAGNKTHPDTRFAARCVVTTYFAKLRP